MGKSHIVNIDITNISGRDLNYSRHWFDSGRLSDNYEWPKLIANDTEAIIQCCEKDYSPVGCSGYVVYKAENEEITIAFSNPSVGNNKVGIGSNGDKTWADMGDHDYKIFFAKISDTYSAIAQCTESSTNNAKIILTSCINFQKTSKSHAVNLTILNYSGLELTYFDDWFDTGGVGDGQCWPKSIPNRHIGTVQCYEKNYAVTGCSGYATYKTITKNIAFSFSNPLAGENKIGVGTLGPIIWDAMTAHYDNLFQVYISNDIKAFICCTNSSPNYGFVFLSRNLESWMSNLCDEKYLYELCIPGTHDSCALYAQNTFSKCQNYGITSQLNLGVRFLDIRCAVSPTGELLVYHGPIYQHISMDEVLDEVAQFIERNPSETIIMSLKEEGDKNPNFCTIFLNSYYINNKYCELFYQETTVPKLKDARKKIVLIRRFDSGTRELGINAYSGWKDNSAFFLINGECTLAVQDLYNPTELEQKKEAIKKLLSHDEKYNKNLIMNFSSGYEGTPTPNGPENFSNKINPWLYDFLRKNENQWKGIIAMDFPILNNDSISNHISSLILTIINNNWNSSHVELVDLDAIN
ncbi:phosphatidylinositol-specific phospholipase C [Dickeya lacustris]|uniref:1-phosphatidylinositol phosphodiesterase n=1 Tax=Dickeya lacustris TaxID=2259638 RepID=A0ABY8G6Z5_9GAMM|nr:phosphatidylinositol-specific phospholipase C [Dickeya lacustris]WFN55727.1 phosphatidylinositol-specific phospholipase C [Dickeya lacustris]